MHKPVFRPLTVVSAILLLPLTTAFGAVIDPITIDVPTISTSTVQLGIRFKLKGSTTVEQTATDQFSNEVTQSLSLSSERTKEESFETSLSRSIGVGGSAGSERSISVTAGMQSNSKSTSKWFALDRTELKQFFESKASRKRVLTITSMKAAEFDDSSGYMKYSVAVENSTLKYFTIKSIRIAVHRVRPWESSIDLGTAEHTYEVGGQSVVTGSIPGFGTVSSNNGTLQLVVPPTSPGVPVVFNVSLDKLPTSDVHQLLSDDSILVARVVGFELWEGTTPVQVFPTVERAKARTRNVEVTILGRGRREQSIFVTPQAGDTLADVLRTVSPDLELAQLDGVTVVSRMAGLVSDPTPIPKVPSLYDANMKAGRWVIGAAGDALKLEDQAKAGMAVTVAWVTNLDLVKLFPQKVEIKPFVIFRNCALTPNQSQTNGYMFSWPFPILTPPGSVVQLEFAEQKRYFAGKELPSRQVATQLASQLEPNAIFVYSNPSALASLSDGGRFEVTPSSRLADPAIVDVAWGTQNAQSALAIAQNDGAIAPFVYLTDINGAEGTPLADGFTRVVFHTPSTVRMPFRLALPGRVFNIPWGRSGTTPFRYFSNGEIDGLSRFARRISRNVSFVDARAAVIRGYVTLPIEVTELGKLLWNQENYARGPANLPPSVAANTAIATESSGAILPRPLGDVPTRDMLRKSLPEPIASSSGRWGSSAWEANTPYSTCNYFGP